MTPLCSILIPCGPNHLGLLDRAVESAKTQTVPVEVLTYIDHERHGPGYGRNRLARQARGLFLSYLDSDDYLYPHAIERMLAAWEPGSYVYSDWDELDEAGQPLHVESTSCYVDWRVNKPGQRSYHLTPVLFPAKLHHALGGYSETMYSAEDTDFFLKANVAGIKSIRVHEPLFVYSTDGGHARSTSGKEHPTWFGVLGKLIQDYQRRASVGCCGDVIMKDVMDLAHQENDILVVTNWKGNRRVIGKATGRKYGRHGNGKRMWLDPRDYAAEKRFFEVAGIEGVDPQALSPTSEQIQVALASGEVPTVVALAQSVWASGVRNWATMEKPGLDMQQVPDEIAALLHAALEQDVGSVLEIGTGESGGLARYMASALGWDVLSIDLNVPETFAPAEPGGVMRFESGGSWDVWQMNSQDAETVASFSDETSQRNFDLVFIDGNHEYEAVKADHEHYGGLGRIVAFHDISPDGWWQGAAQYWREIAYTKAGNLRKGYHEAIVPGAKTGLGWYVAE